MSWTCPDCGAPFAAPMRFLAIQVRKDRLLGHVLLERTVTYPVIIEIVPDAYGSGLYPHRLEIFRPDDLDASFAILVREAAARVGRRKRFAGGAAKPIRPVRSG